MTETHATQDGVRVDKWLWFTRVVKSRTLATGLVSGGKVRVNRAKVEKPSQKLRPGDVVTVTAHRHVRVLRVVKCGERRGPASEAQSLYEDLTPPTDGQTPPNGAAPSAEGEMGAAASQEPGRVQTTQAHDDQSKLGHNQSATPIGTREAGSGRPTKRDRRALDRLRGDD